MSNLKLFLISALYVPFFSSLQRRTIFKCIFPLFSHALVSFFLDLKLKILWWTNWSWQFSYCLFYIILSMNLLEYISKVVSFVFFIQMSSSFLSNFSFATELVWETIWTSVLEKKASRIHPGKSNCELPHLLAHKASWWRHWFAFLHFAPLPWLCEPGHHLATISWWKSSGPERHSNHIRWMGSLYAGLHGLITFVQAVPV